MAKKGNKASHALRFIASLVFLYVVFGGWLSISVSAGGAVSAVEAIALAIGLLSSIALFFTSLAGLGMDSAMISENADKAVMWAAFPLLIAVVATGAAVTSTALWAVVIGYIIAWIGMAMEKRA